MGEDPQEMLEVTADYLNILKIHQEGFSFLNSTLSSHDHHFSEEETPGGVLTHEWQGGRPGTTVYTSVVQYFEATQRHPAHNPNQRLPGRRFCRHRIK